MIPGINEVQTLATKYSKAQLAQMAQNGLIDPTKAVMAGMMIDRISKQNMEPPKSTVAQDVMAPPAPQMGMPQGQPQQAPSAGVASIPAPNMESMAGGGIVAFAKGGTADDTIYDPMTGMPIYGYTESENAAPASVSFSDYFVPGRIELLKKAEANRKATAPVQAPVTQTPTSKDARTKPTPEVKAPGLAAAPRPTEAPPLTAPVFKPELLTGRGFDVTQDKARADEFATAYGVDPEYFKKQRDKLEKEGEEIPKEKEQAKWMSLAEAGLAIASGDSQYALQNIAKGSSKGLEAYKGYQKDIKEKQRLLKDREARISEAEQLEKRGQSAAAQVRRDKAMEHDDRIAEINAKAMSEAEKNNLQATFSVQKALWDRYNLTEDQQVEANRQILLQGARDKAAMERVVATVAGSIDRVDTIPAKDLAKLRMEVEANYGPQIKKTLQSKYGSNANIEAEYQRQLNAKLNSITGGSAAPASGFRLLPD